MRSVQRIGKITSIKGKGRRTRGRRSARNRKQACNPANGIMENLVLGAALGLLRTPLKDALSNSSDSPRDWLPVTHMKGLLPSCSKDPPCTRKTKLKNMAAGEKGRWTTPSGYKPSYFRIWGTIF